MKYFRAEQEAVFKDEKLEILKNFLDENRNFLKHSEEWIEAARDRPEDIEREFLNLDFIKDYQNFQDLKNFINISPFSYSCSANLNYLFAFAAKMGREDIVDIGSRLGFSPSVVLRNLCHSDNGDADLSKKFAGYMEDLIKLGADPLFVPDLSVINWFSLFEDGKNSLEILIKRERYEDFEKILQTKNNLPTSQKDALKKYEDCELKYKQNLEIHKHTESDFRYVLQKTLSEDIEQLDNIKKSISDSENIINSFSKIKTIYNSSNPSLLNLGLIVHNLGKIYHYDDYTEKKQLVFSVVKLIVDGKGKELENLLSKNTSLDLSIFNEQRPDGSVGGNSLIEFARSIDGADKEIEGILAKFNANSQESYKNYVGDIKTEGFASDFNQKQESASDNKKLEILKIFLKETEGAYEYSPSWLEQRPNAEKSLNFEHIYNCKNFLELKNIIDREFYNSVIKYPFALAAKLDCKEIIEIGSDLGFTPNHILQNLFLNFGNDKNLNKKFINICLEDLLKLGADPLSDSYFNDNTGKPIVFLQFLIDLEEYEHSKKILDIKMKNPELLSKENLQKYQHFKDHYELSIYFSNSAKENLLYVQEKIFSMLTKSFSDIKNSNKSEDFIKLQYIHEKNEAVFGIFNQLKDSLQTSSFDAKERNDISLAIKFVADGKSEELEKLFLEQKPTIFNKLRQNDGHADKESSILYNFAISLDNNDKKTKEVLEKFEVKSCDPSNFHYQLLVIPQDPSENYLNEKFDCPSKVAFSGEHEIIMIAIVI